MAKLLLIEFSFLPLLLLQYSATSSSDGIRIELGHIDSNEDFTLLELLSRAVERTNQRTASGGSTSASSPTSTDAQAPVYAGDGEFIMELAIGTPPVSYLAIMDTGSDLIWAKCQPCKQCSSQLAPLYSPSKSPTFAALPCTSAQCRALPRSACSPDNCSYVYSYGDKSYTKGVLGTETFTFGASTPAPAMFSDIAFGCATTIGGNLRNSSGLVGMARESSSLVSQLGVGRFSYCLTPFGDRKKSPFLLGSLATLSEKAQSTPFVNNPNSNYFSSFYYLSLQGITVGRTMLPISNATFAINANGTGGMIIDSGTTITSLLEPAYTALKREISSQINLPEADGSAYGFDICFLFTAADEPSLAKVPILIFHFEGADLELPLENYIFADSGNELMCVLILKYDDLPFSIFGNVQQQNIHILYDLVGGTLSFERYLSDSVHVRFSLIHSCC